MPDEFYMQLALNEAWNYQLLTYPNPAVGAVVMRNGEILSVEAHQRAGTSHAEVLALVRAYEQLSSQSVAFDPFNAFDAHDFLRKLPETFFSECTIYVTLEPCAHEGQTPSCASLLRKLGLKRVVVGLQDPITGHGGGAAQLDNVTMGVLKEACQDLLEPFMIWQERAFVFFKLAQTTNGRIGGGYLSSKASLTHVHQLRAVCDRLLIGGDTVRTDRPTLDCRFSGGRAPDVTILTRKDDIDREIPLFKVDGREVEVGTSLDLLQKPSLVMVEGGEGMLRLLQAHIDWFLLYQTPKLSTNDLSYNIEMNLAFLHTARVDVDLMIWSRRLGH